MSAAETVRSLCSCFLRPSCGAIHLSSFNRFLVLLAVCLLTFWMSLNSVLWAGCTVWVFDGMCEEFPECVFLVWYVNVCVYMWVFFFFFLFFLRGSSSGPGVLKGARQLPFTAPGGNKQRGRGSYLPLLLGKEAEEETLLGSHCNYTQLQGK